MINVKIMKKGEKRMFRNPKEISLNQETQEKG